MAMPRERAVVMMFRVGSSISRAKGEYSIWRAEMGWMAWARRRVEADTSLRPGYLILPCLGGRINMWL
jgi:hypothetical protein